MVNSSPPQPGRDATDTLSEADSDSETISWDAVFDVLSNQRRRETLRYLLDASGSVTLGDLAEHIASIENDKPEEALSSSERKRVYISLYQAHLPKMDQVGIIKFDQSRKTIERDRYFDDVIDFHPGYRDRRASKESGPLQRIKQILQSVRTRLRD